MFEDGLVGIVQQGLTGLLDLQLFGLFGLLKLN